MLNDFLHLTDHLMLLLLSQKNLDNYPLAVSNYINSIIKICSFEVHKKNTVSVVEINQKYTLA